jgi:hypothetical protein
LILSNIEHHFCQLGIQVSVEVGDQSTSHHTENLIIWSWCCLDCKIVDLGQWAFCRKLSVLLHYICSTHSF